MRLPIFCYLTLLLKHTAIGIKASIVELLENYNELSVVEITKQLNVSKQSVHLCMKQLLDESIVQKYGKVPVTFYKLIAPHHAISDLTQIQLSEDEKNTIASYTMLSPSGELLYGIEAMQYYCKLHNKGLHEHVKLYVAERTRLNRIKDTSGLINGHNHFRQLVGISDYEINDLYHVDHKCLGNLGSSQLGTLVDLAKSVQHDELFEEIIHAIKKQIVNFIYMSDFDAVAFVPRTIPREKQLMKVLEEGLSIALPKVVIHKVVNQIPVAQKSLSLKEDRKTNAENSFMIPQQPKYKHLLLIDDIMTSGATLNTIGLKIKRKKIAIKITGLTILLDNHVAF
jgi:predicted DNA-binding protein YlxM (UPF0122 family)